MNNPASFPCRVNIVVLGSSPMSLTCSNGYVTSYIKGSASEGTGAHSAKMHTDSWPIANNELSFSLSAQSWEGDTIASPSYSWSDWGCGGGKQSDSPKVKSNDPELQNHNVNHDFPSLCLNAAQTQSSHIIQQEPKSTKKKNRPEKTIFCFSPLL